MKKKHLYRKYFTTHPYLQRRYDKMERKLAFSAKTAAAWKKWRHDLRKKLKELTGYATMTKAPLKPKITERRRFLDYIRERIEIQTEPGVIMTLYALLPKKVKPPYPVVINPHGHGSGGKLATAGRYEIPQIAETIKQHNYDYGIQYTRAGFASFCPDARGFGERQESIYQEDTLGSSCSWLNQMAMSLGQTVTGMWAWDIHRLIDYIQTRRDCDSKRLGCAGLSGGGLQTLWATALDDRIRAAVISGYLYGNKESLMDMSCCWCNYVPHLYENVDMGDIGALIAPRPLLVETGTQDGLNGVSNLKNVRSQMRIMRRAYGIFQKQKLLYHDVFEGPHMWHGVHAIPWMKRWLG